MRLFVTKRFEKNLHKLKTGNSEYATKVGNTLKMLIEHPDLSCLRYHKIRGSADFSISVDMSIRIKIHKEGEVIYLLDIGKHEDIY